MRLPASCLFFVDLSIGKGLVDLYQDRLACEEFLSSRLGCQVVFVPAIQLTQSSRTASW